MVSITDGTSNTVMVGERVPSNTPQPTGPNAPDFGWWFAGTGLSGNGETDVILGTGERHSQGGAQEVFRNGTLNDPGDVHRWHYWSIHLGGAHFLFADGSVRFLTYATDAKILNALGTYNGGEPTP